MTPVRLVFAEDNFLVREGVRRLLAASEALQVVAVCDGLDQALKAIAEHVPDVVLTDIRMPPTHSDEGIRIAEECRRTYPTMGVLLLSQYAEAGYVKVLLRHGTDRRGYLLKERVASIGELTSAIEAVASGGTAIDPRVVEALVQVRARAGDAKLDRLTPREREVLAGIAQGHTNAGVAAELFLSQHAVEKHINSIFGKLGLTGDTRHHPRVRAALMFLAEDRH
ncbi:MAG: response regulator transcription factor [Intrasporangium sp.]|uniref:response regulator transcription factor n=1 Tax=Intrasporangium sp. TaxID=1925024 RepID=UPI0026478F8A|nr:response regulator transcription factor [Intrasporangium sp.]MDN5796622.1 response regulator transcription factor [Intrasporangium sp.]